MLPAEKSKPRKMMQLIHWGMEMVTSNVVVMEEINCQARAVWKWLATMIPMYLRLLISYIPREGDEISKKYKISLDCNMTEGKWGGGADVWLVDMHFTSTQPAASSPPSAGTHRICAHWLQIKCHFYFIAGAKRVVLWISRSRIFEWIEDIAFLFGTADVDVFPHRSCPHYHGLWMSRMNLYRELR